MPLIRFSLILCLALVLGSCGSDPAATADPAPPTSTAPAAAPEKAAPSANDFTFVPNERFGKLTASTKGSDIPALYGEEAIPTNEIHIGEGEMVSGYLLFAGTKNRAEVIVGETGLTVIVRHKNGDWRMAGTGLHVGTTLAELNALNGNAFELYGFEWDYGGMVADWKGGKLTDVGLSTAYNNLKFVGDNADNSLIGDHTLSSDNPALEPIEVTVAEIVISF